MIDPIQLAIVVCTIKMEAEAEPFIGKLAVAWVIANRMRTRSQSAADVCLDAFQFSCWNTKEPTRKRLDDQETNRQAWLDSYKAAWAALYALVPDPTKGATSYLNPDVCTPQQKLNAGYHPSRVTIRLGHHDFFIAA